MGFLPNLAELNTYRSITEIFGGFDHNLKIASGAWYEEENISSASYPLFSPRGRRALAYPHIDSQGNTHSYQGIIAKDALAYVDGNKLYYNGYEVQMTGVTISTDASMCPKQMVSMGAYLVIFPDGIYVNTQNLSEYGYLAAHYSQPSGDMTVEPCTIDGASVDPDAWTVSPTQPVSPDDGDYWVDTSTTPHSLKVFSAATQAWTASPTVYCKIGSIGIGTLFEEQDAVTISGMPSAQDPTVAAELASLNGSYILIARGDDYIVVTALISEVVETSIAGVHIDRNVPKMDFVCELDNRLWGCFYGYDPTAGEVRNIIYASALGNPKVWNRFAGISTDSYSVSVGSDGPFTGMVSHAGYVLAWKEGCVHKVYGTMPSNFQLTTTVCNGVQNGSARSLVVVNNILYFKGIDGVYAYDGSMPTFISGGFGGVLYSSACAGACNNLYCISMKDADDDWHMFVYDAVRGIWHREDAVHAVMMAAYDSDLLYIDAETGAIMSETGKHGTPEADVEWSCVSGIIGYEYPDRKYNSRFDFRVRITAESECSVYLQYDSSGVWEFQGTIRPTKRNGIQTQTYVLPVIPRRCDHMQIKITGKNDVRIYSIAKILEIGSDA